MWQAQIARTERNGDTLNIIVVYTDQNGNEFNQTLTVSNSQDPSWLQGQITNKLNQLADLDTFQATVNSDKAIASVMSIDPNTSALALNSISNPITSIETPITNVGETS